MSIHIACEVLAKEIKCSVSMICDTHICYGESGGPCKQAAYDIVWENRSPDFHLKYSECGLYMCLQPASCSLSAVLLCLRWRTPVARGLKAHVHDEMCRQTQTKCFWFTCKPEVLPCVVAAPVVLVPGSSQGTVLRI